MERGGGISGGPKFIRSSNVIPIAIIKNVVGVKILVGVASPCRNCFGGGECDTGGSTVGRELRRLSSTSRGRESGSELEEMWARRLVWGLYMN